MFPFVGGDAGRTGRYPPGARAVQHPLVGIDAYSDDMESAEKARKQAGKKVERESIVWTEDELTAEEKKEFVDELTTRATLAALGRVHGTDYLAMRGDTVIGKANADDDHYLALEA